MELFGGMCIELNVTAEYGVPKFKIGETVRIVKYKNIFTKGYRLN